jgi:RND family efflux transporter MFP subunit
VNRLAAQVKYDRSQAARMENLLSQNAIAKSARDQAVSTRDMDAGALAQAQAAMDKSDYELKHSDIRAPFPGRVVARLINPGEYATAGKPVVRLVDIGSTEVSVQTPIDAARYLREGMPLTVDIEGRPVIAKVRAIVPVGDIASRTIEVRLTLPAAAGFVGDAAKVFIPSAEPRDVVAVPRDALVLREDNTYIFKVDGKSKAERIAVETGAEEGAMVEVKGLIAPGERVIVRGAERLEAGQIVKPAMAS